MIPSDTFRAQRIIRLLRAGEELGLDRADMMKAAGVTASAVLDPDVHVPIVKAIHLWQYIVDKVPDPDLGLRVGSRIQAREGGVVGYAMLHSTTVRGALKRLVRYSRILSRQLALTLSREGGRWRFRSENDPLIKSFRQPIDEGMAGVLTLLREITETEIEPVEAHFPYERPPGTRELVRLFKCRLRFGQPKPALLLSEHSMQEPIRAADEKLSHYLDQLAEIQLGKAPGDESFTNRVGRAIWPRLSEGQPSVADTAAALAVSARTLQRRLCEEGTTYAQVLDTLRRDKAGLLLRDRRITVSEVGYLLGYADASAFYRAFRRWNHTAPSRYRQ